MKVARVSKLNGLKSSVMGNSFIISTKHNIPPAIIDLETNGIVTFKIVFCSEFPSVLLAEKIFGDVLLNPEFTEPKPMALNLITYAISNTRIVPLRNIFDSEEVKRIDISLFILSKNPAVDKTPIAKIVPGNAYPLAEKFAKNFNILFLLIFVAQATNVEIIIIIPAPKNEIIIVLNKTSQTGIDVEIIFELIMLFKRIIIGNKKPHMKGIKQIKENKIVFKNETLTGFM